MQLVDKWLNSERDFHVVCASALTWISLGPSLFF